MPQAPGRTPRGPEGPQRCPGAEDQPPEASQAPAREAMKDMGKQLKGVLGTKLGMTQVFNDQGRIVPVTVVAAGPCVVTAVRTAPEDGYAAVQLGYGDIDPRRVTKPVAGHFAKADVPVPELDGGVA